VVNPERKERDKLNKLIYRRQTFEREVEGRGCNITVDFATAAVLKSTVL
jgi:hypothetical protein